MASAKGFPSDLATLKLAQPLIFHSMVKAFPFDDGSKDWNRPNCKFCGWGKNGEREGEEGGGERERDRERERETGRDIKRETDRQTETERQSISAMLQGRQSMVIIRALATQIKISKKVMGIWQPSSRSAKNGNTGIDGDLNQDQQSGYGNMATYFKVHPHPNK